MWQTKMLRPYPKIWEWELIFGRAVKAISSPGVRSPSPKMRYIFFHKGVVISNNAGIPDHSNLLLTLKQNSRKTGWTGLEFYETRLTSFIFFISHFPGNLECDSGDWTHSNMQSNGEAVNKVSIAIWIVKFLRVGYKIVSFFFSKINILKVSKSQKQISKFSFEPKTEQKYSCIPALASKNP